MSVSKPILGYWDIRCLAESIRYLLHYLEVDFDDKRYETVTNGSWLSDKHNLNLDFPNLPYYIEGGVKLTQSIAIIRYLARKHGLVGKTDEEKNRVDLVEQQIVDFRSSFINVSYSPEFETLKDELLKNLPTQLQLFSSFLGDRSFLAGGRITYVDFLLYETIEWYLYLLPTALDDFENLRNFQARIENLPTLKSYLKSYKRWPFNFPTASFGGKGEEPKRK